MAEDFYSVAEIDPSYVQDDAVYSSTADSYIDEESYRSVYTQTPSAYTNGEDDVDAPNAYSDGAAEPSSTYYGENSESSSSYTDTADAPTSSGYAYGQSSEDGSYSEMTASTDSYVQTPSQPPEPAKPEKAAPNEFSFMRNSTPGKPAPLVPVPIPVPSHAHTHQVVSSKGDYYKQKNWNREFQDLLKAPDSEEKYTALSRLANEFVFVAQTYGKVIISELSVPAEEKTVRPVSIGGIAGGEKYIVQGILFKFALDISGIYCGDENAMKAAGHEIIGLSNYSFTQISGLHFPLMCLIRYCGFCLVAMSILPIGKDTLMYGSSDGGKTVQFGDDDLSAKMEAAGLKMNLKPHYAGTNLERKIVGPGDIEGHRSRDGEFYVVDFARVFPPEASLPGDAKEPGRILYKLLRPELVTRYKCPLSSDALTGWGKRDPDSKLHNAEVVEATKHLLLEILPEFAADLLRATDQRMLSNIPAAMKQRGINLRHLGLVRNLVVTLKDTPEAKDISSRLLVEMFARLLKSRVQEEWRRTVRSHYHINNEMCKEQALEILNSFVDFKSQDALRYYSTDAKPRLLSKFRGALMPEELAPEFDIRHLLKCQDLLSIVDRFSSLTGFQLHTQARTHFGNAFHKIEIHSVSTLRGTAVFKFLRCDAGSIDVTIKHTNIVDFADIQALLIGGVNQADLKSSNRYFLLVLEALQRSPHMALMGAHKLLEICAILTRKFKLHVTDDELRKTLSSLVLCLLTSTDELSLSLRVPILVKAATLIRRVGTPEAKDAVVDRLVQVTKEDPDNITALMALLKMSIGFGAKLQVADFIDKLQALCPQNPKFNMIMANDRLSAIKFTTNREEEISKLLGYFSLAAQMDPAVVRKARFLPDPKAQEAQLHIAAAVPLYRPPLREYYSSHKILHLEDPSPGGGDGILAPLLSGECLIEKIDLIKAVGLSDAGLEMLVRHLKVTLKKCYLVGTYAAGVSTAATLRNCTALVGVKLSGTSVSAAEALSVIKDRPEFATFHVEGMTDFTDETFAKLAELPLAGKLGSLGVGDTGITIAGAPTFAKFSSLSKLFLRKTTLPWTTCKDILLSIPTCAIFSIEGAPAIANGVVFSDAIDISLPMLELIVMPNGGQILFSGPYRCTAHIIPNVGYNARMMRDLNGATVFSKHKAVNSYLLTFPATINPKNLNVFTLSGGPPGTVYTYEVATGFGRKYAIAYNGDKDKRFPTELATLDLVQATRQLNLKIKDAKTQQVNLGNPVAIAFKLGDSELRHAHNATNFVIPPKGNITWTMIAAAAVFGVARKL